MTDTNTRNEFAAHALQGMLAHPKRYKPREGDGVNWHESIAREAFELADAMVAATDRPTRATAARALIGRG